MYIGIKLFMEYDLIYICMWRMFVIIFNNDNF